MILQALARYYLRESQRKQSRIAPYGMEKKEIKFIIEIDEDGAFVNLIDTRADGKNGKKFLVPKSEGRSGSASWKTANLLWDHYGYVLGQPQYNKNNKNAPGQMSSFIARIESLPEELKNNREIAAVRKFYDNGGEIQKVLAHQDWPKCNKIAGCNLTFQLDDESTPVTENIELRRWLSTEDEGTKGSDAKTEMVFGRCLVSGEVGEITRTHDKVQIRGNQAALVGFQKNSGYDSYGKEQGYNAPVSQKAHFYYVSALKTLLNSDYNRVDMADTVLLFWAAPKIISDETAEKTEKSVKLLCTSPKDNANLGVENVKNVFESIFTGKTPSDIGDRFYILGLSPNKARVSVVFWKNGSIKEIAQNVLQYFKDIEIISSKWKNLSFCDILSSSEYKGKMENVPPNMMPALIYSVFNGTPYPSALFSHIMERVRAEGNPTFPRAAFIKAYLNRKYKNTKGVEITVALDRENTNPAYRLGRLFAVLEKAQEEANPGINATIRDRFYSAMSSSPASVFPIMIRLKNYHLEKLTVGRKINMECEIMEILSSLQPEAMPKHLTLEEQGYFAIGYYHERQYLYSKKDN